MNIRQRKNECEGVKEGKSVRRDKWTSGSKFLPRKWQSGLHGPGATRVLSCGSTKKNSRDPTGNFAAPTHDDSVNSLARHFEE